MTGPTKLREPEVLAAQLAELRTDSLWTGSTFNLGASDALRWLIAGGFGPLTGALSEKPVTLRAIVRELSAAEAVIYGHPSDQRQYAEGVEHALMWAQFATCAPPLPAAPRSPPPTTGLPRLTSG